MTGSRAAGGFDRHLRMLRLLKNAAYRLRAGFRREEELPEMLQGLQTQELHPIGRLLAEAGKSIETGEVPDPAFWKKLLEKESALDTEDRSNLVLWLSHLSVGDRRLREDQLLQMEEYLTEKEHRIQREKERCGKLYRSLGFLMGLAAAIMLLCRGGDRENGCIDYF